MSGYLQRLAASAARPTSAVYPLVGGLFSSEHGSASSPASNQHPVELDLFAESDRPPSPHSWSAEAQQPTQRQADKAIRTAQRNLTQSEDADEPTRATPRPDLPRSSFSLPSPREPLVAGWNQIADPQRSLEETATKPGSERRRVQAEHVETVSAIEQHAERSSSEQPGQSPAVQAAWSASNVRRAKDSMIEAAAPHQGSELTPVEAFRNSAQQSIASGPRVTGIDRPTVNQQQMQKDQAGRGAEDIQIHIGRIEVIAVPQQPQRAIPARTQRGESLEAYLKRHERRSR